MVNKYLKYFLLLLLYHFSITTNAQMTDDFPPKPTGQNLVNNLSTSAQDILSKEEMQMLETKLRAFSDSTSNQIAILIVDETKGYDPNEYASRVAEKWGLGKADKNNGVIILIVNPYRNPEFGPRSLSIQVGYGLEEVIPDLATKQIRENEINPYFKNKNFYEGLNKGTDVLMNLAIGKYKVKDYLKRGDSPFKIVVVIIIIIIIIFFLSRGGGRGTTYSSRGIFWGGMSGLGGGSWNSGGGNESGGGGWGGFGGGSFGGGGSSGDW